MCDSSESCLFRLERGRGFHSCPLLLPGWRAGRGRSGPSPPAEQDPLPGPLPGRVGLLRAEPRGRGHRGRRAAALQGDGQVRENMGWEYGLDTHGHGGTIGDDFSHTALKLLNKVSQSGVLTYCLPLPASLTRAHV